jgi:peptide deformylase
MILVLAFMSLFLPPNDPALNERIDGLCPCYIASEEIQQNIDQMLDVSYSHTKDRTQSVLVGLAAPQIGIWQRIILVDKAATGIFKEDTIPQPPELKIYIDPEILWKSGEITFFREGCFSTSSICGIVPRSRQIIIRAYDREGNLFTEELFDYTARIFQHEVDHLDGIRFPDRIENDADLHWVEPEEIPNYRIHWANWSQKCPRGKWLEIKNS